MRASLTGWATVQVQGERALVLPAPDLDALYAGLEWALEGHWAIRYAVDHIQPPVVRASLSLGRSGADETGPGETGSGETGSGETVPGVPGSVRVREGLGQGHTLQDSRLLALADALRAFGVAPASSEGQWVEYDPEEGANTHELEPEQPAPIPGVPAPLSSAPSPDPQLERARKHIDDLLEGLREEGLGARAARVLSSRGYGNTVEESREVYKDLKALKS